MFIADLVLALPEYPDFQQRAAAISVNQQKLLINGYFACRQLAPGENSPAPRLGGCPVVVSVIVKARCVPSGARRPGVEGNPRAAFHFDLSRVAPLSGTRQVHSLAKSPPCA
jgi:hypothetical protein